MTMPTKRRKAASTPLIPEVSSELTAGDNREFLTRQIGVYLERLFNRRPIVLDRETLRFVCFALESEHAGRLCEFLQDQLSNPLKTALAHELEEADDMDDVGASLVKFLQRSTKKIRRKFGKELKTALSARMAALETSAASQVEANIEAVTRIFGLNADEREMILFLLVIVIFDEADHFFMTHLQCEKPFFRQNLATLLGMTRRRLYDALSGKLRKLEIIEADANSLALNDDFIDILENPERALTSQESFVRAADSGLPLNAHLVDESHTRILRRLLQKKPDSSTHILLYGPPGTGKSSYARSILNELDTPSYEIVNNEQNSSAVRRGAILSCIHFTNSGDRSIIMVDEADNLLNTMFSWFEAGETRDKGWVNHLLEEKGLRMIWIVNELSMDESIYRRFAYSIQFHPFTRKQRISLWQNVLKRYGKRRALTATDVEALATRYDASAGGVELAVRKAVEVGIKGKDNFKQFLDQVLVSHLTLMNEGGKPARPKAPGRNFLVEGLNIKSDFSALISDVKAYDAHWRQHLMADRPSLSMLFYGPPGTGKSETARYLAEAIDRDLMICKASDILDKYVGGTEKNLAGIFSEAEDKGAALLIDEADSFLMKREEAHRSWEITQTNEFLTQLENFAGLVICTTNRMPGLDSAAPRRFNRKIAFDYLTPEGKLLFYEKMLAHYVNRRLGDPEKARLTTIPDLTPGDFKVVQNQHFLDAPGRLSHDNLIAALETESRVKARNGGRIVSGFTSRPIMIDRKRSA